ncbi:MAG: carboxymuconolactone decarboxylase family protein [Muricauda sp.]|nr:carboxymuconolactone decarboxylase family protein [Allomuricauda sp.]
MKRMFYKNRIMGLIVLLCVCSTQAQSTKDSNGALRPAQESMVKIASLTAQGNLEQLSDELNHGLDNGLTVNEIKEVLVHLYAYCGFPRSIRGLQTFLDVLDDRKEKGIKDVWGREASAITDTRDKYDRGIETLEELLQVKMDGPKPAYQQFSPAMDVFLKEHLFADIFERDVLTYAQRELTTISVIASLGNLDPMLRSHLSISLKVGHTPEQLKAFVGIIGTTAGKEKAKAAQAVLRAVLSESQ